MRALALPTAVVVAFLLILGCRQATQSRSPAAPLQLAAAPKVGDPAPEIDGEDTDGAPMKLSDQRGKVVVLHFWGHW